MRKLVISAILVAIFIATDAGSIIGAERGSRGGNSGSGVSKNLGTPLATMLNINRVASWYNANGEQERNPTTSNSGLYYPRGTSTAIYSAGLVWGGRFNDGRTPVLRVNGQSYNNGTKPGAILGLRTGVAEDPGNADVRIFRIRKDYATADLRQDAAELNSIGIANVTDAQISTVRNQYAKDWAEWPWQKGAPFYDNGYIGPNPNLTDTLGRNNSVLDWGEDANHNGILDAGEDANGNNVLDGETPGVAGADQVIWYVCNDINVAQPWTCPETGMEEQATIWGYDRTDPLGNTIFKRFRLIYKGIASTPANARVDSMYMCQWSDPDLGAATDDFAGCDTALSVGYVYNAQPVDADYAQFNLPPPASGYDFLQGPLVRGVALQDLNRNGVDDALDYGIWDLKRTAQGWINLPMTSFIYFAAGGRYSDPPFTYTGAIQWYQMLRGLPPTPTGPPDPLPYINPVTNQPTSYWLSGDPVAGTGWIDGSIDPQGDRRFLLCTGPFTMVLGDTQELVSAWVGGLGNDNKGSIKVLKFNDKSVQLAYDNLFDLPKAPPAPRVQASTLANQVLLDWGWDSTSLAATESTVYIGGYRFEGYKVYQFSSATGDLSTAKLLAKYDVVNNVKSIFQETFDPSTGEILVLPVQFGTDNGIVHRFAITEDAYRARPLVNGQRYYFAVTAYNYTPDVNKPIRTLESAPRLIIVTPELPKPGTRYPYSIGDTVRVRDVVGRNDARIYPVIYNPTLQKGDVYEVRFDTTAAGVNRWTLANTTTGTTLFANITDFSGSRNYEIPSRGFTVRVLAPIVGTASVLDGQGRSVFGGSSPGAAAGFAVLSSTGTLDGITGRGSTGRNFELRFDTTVNYALRTLGPQRSVVRVPFSAWDLGRISTDTARRVIPVFQDTAGGGTVWNIKPGPRVGGYVVFDPIWITSAAYPSATDTAAVKTAIQGQATALSAVVTSQTNALSAVHRAYIADLDLDTNPPAAGTTIRFNKYLEIHAGDAKSINLSAVTIGDRALAAKDIEAIKAFPNPYYGVNRAETDRVYRFITFNHLPDRATIRIFNLAGVLVRVLEKNDPPGSTQFLNWDLQNSNGLPVASGIYIAYIEVPDLGVTKTLKLVIIQEQQFLRYY